MDAVVRLIERGGAADAAHVTHSGRGMQQIAHETVAQVRACFGAVLWLPLVRRAWAAARTATQSHR